MNHKNINNTQKITVNTEDLKTFVCKCGGSVFWSVHKFKILPALYSPSGDTQLIGLPYIKCTLCGEEYTIEDITKGETYVS